MPGAAPWERRTTDKPWSGEELNMLATGTKQPGLLTTEYWARLPLMKRDMGV